MRWLSMSLFLIPSLLLAKQLTFFIPATYPLNIVNTQLICASLHASLSSDALSKLETLSDVPFTCTYKQDPNNSQVKDLIITLTLKEE